MTDRRTKSRLVKEIVILVILGLLIGGFTLLQFGKSTPKAEKKEVPKLQTTFDTETAEVVEAKDTDFPEITADGVGKPDPFR